MLLVSQQHDGHDSLIKDNTISAGNNSTIMNINAEVLSDGNRLMDNDIVKKSVVLIQDE